MALLLAQLTCTSERVARQPRGSHCRDRQPVPIAAALLAARAPHGPPYSTAALIWVR